MKSNLLIALAIVLVASTVSAFAGPWISGKVFYGSAPDTTQPAITIPVTVTNSSTGASFTTYTGPDPRVTIPGMYWFTLYGSGTSYFMCVRSGGLWAHQTFTTTGIDMHLPYMWLRGGIHPPHNVMNPPDSRD